VAVEENAPLTRKVLAVLTERSPEEVGIEDLVTQLGEDPKKLRVALNNLRANNPEVAQRIKVIVPGQLWRYENGTKKVTAKRPVQDTALPEPGLVQVADAFADAEARAKAEAEALHSKTLEIEIEVQAAEIKELRGQLDEKNQLLREATAKPKPGDWRGRQLALTSKGILLVELEDGKVYAVKEVPI
jgi:hypothetical protein